jgi:hypothetical protein
VTKAAERNGATSNANASAPAAVTADEVAARRAADEFAGDVLTGCKWWRSGTASTRWLAVKPPPDRPADALLEHLRGQRSYSVGPISKTIVIDVDLPQYREDKRQEALLDQKLSAASAVSGVLNRFDIPHLHVDSRGGLHTWIRCEINPTTESLQGLAARLDKELDGFELRPAGGRGIRLPFGVSNGVARRSLGKALTDAEILDWLATPPRATQEQLRLLGEHPPAIDGAPALEPLPGVAWATAPADAYPVEPPYDVPGWERWPRCKQLKFASGLDRSGERHWTWLMVAAEALLHAPHLSHEELVALQRAVPLNGHSSSLELELDADAMQNASDLLARLGAGRPLRTGCPRSPGKGDSPLRNTFKGYCWREDAKRCSILCPLPAGLTPYRDVLRSSIWRGAQGGKTSGLGLAARAVFEFAVEMAGGEPGVAFELSERYIEVRMTYVPARAAAAALKRLTGADVGLLQKIDERTYVLKDPPSPEEVSRLERALGTLGSYENALARHKTHWNDRRQARESALGASTDVRRPFW